VGQLAHRLAAFEIPDGPLRVNDRTVTFS